MHDDLYSRISSRIQDTEQRLNDRFGRVTSEVKDLGASIDRNDKFLRTHIETRGEFQRKMLTIDIDYLKSRIDHIEEAQAQMQRTLDLIRAAVVLGPDAVRYAMAWDGPPPFVVCPSPASPDVTPADAGTNAD